MVVALRTTITALRGRRFLLLLQEHTVASARPSQASPPACGYWSGRPLPAMGPSWDRGSAWLDLISPRSEEHTSELQSQSNLVCRLLLEKKKKIINKTD